MGEGQSDRLLQALCSADSNRAQHRRHGRRGVELPRSLHTSQGEAAGMSVWQDSPEQLTPAQTNRAPARRCRVCLARRMLTNSGHSTIGATVMRTCMLSVVCAAVSVLAGCAVAPSRESLAVRDADAAMVQGCQFVGYVSGTSGWSGLAADAGESNAQNEAREKAARLGATDIVWQTVHSGFGSTANGNAYRCSREAE